MGLLLKFIMNSKKIFLLFLLLLFFVSCSQTSKNVNSEESNAHLIDEVDPLVIPLEGDISKRTSEISGLCWYNDFLLLLPQYPTVFSNNENGAFYFIKKSRILEYLSGENTSPLLADHFMINLKGFEDLFNKGSGFESVTIINDDIFFTIENMKDRNTNSYIIAGKIDSNNFSIELDRTKLRLVKSDVQIFNMSCETIVAFNEKLIPIYEANGKNVNPNPKSSVFSRNLDLINEIVLPNIEYRITDATVTDSLGYFWAINYFYPGEEKKLKPAFDSIAEKYGIGKSHLNTKVVERLLKFKVINDTIQLAEKSPVYLKLDGNDSRNWEGIAKLDNLGFLLATDTFPETILAFIKYDFNEESK